MKVDEIKKIGLLARIQLSDAECERLGKEFDDILGFVAKLDALDLKDTEAASHPFDLKDVFRKDVVAESLGAKKLMDIAPAHAKDMIVVPQVVDGKD